MNSDQRIELTFKDATDSEPVKLVTPDNTTDEPNLSRASSSGELESSSGDFETEVDSEHCPASLTDSSTCENSDPILHAYSDPGESQSLYQPSVTYSLSGYYPSTPLRSSILPDLKQVFNCAYFTAAALASADLVTTLNNHMLLIFPLLFGMFAVGAFVYSINQRVHISDFSVTLSQRTRFLIRAIALLIPVPIIAGAVCVRLSDHELDLANNAYDAEQYAQATDHLNVAINLNPFNEGAYDAFSRVYFMQSAWALAYDYAQKAIALDPNDSYAWSDKARPLHMMQRNSEAIVAAEKAVQLDPTNGQAFSTLAECYLDAGKYEVALDAAQKHSKIHNTEPYAFELTANILRKLGRDAEATAADAEGGRLATPAQAAPL